MTKGTPNTLVERHKDAECPVRTDLGHVLEEREGIGE